MAASGCKWLQVAAKIRAVVRCITWVNPFDAPLSNGLAYEDVLWLDDAGFRHSTLGSLDHAAHKASLHPTC